MNILLVLFIVWQVSLSLYLGSRKNRMDHWNLVFILGNIPTLLAASYLATEFLKPFKG